MDKKSGTLGLPGHRERQIAVEADHNNICKFASAESENYEQVSLNLVWLVNAAVEAGMERQDTPSSSVPFTKLKPRLDCKHALSAWLNFLSLV